MEIKEIIIKRLEELRTQRLKLADNYSAQRSLKYSEMNMNKALQQMLQSVLDEAKE